MLIEPKVGSCSIVLVGSFNPAIFSPGWFGLNGVVSKTEAESSETAPWIMPDFARFKVGPNIVTVEHNRFSVETNEAPWIVACDLATKTFGELLPHTPIQQVGINRQVHFAVKNEEVRNVLGRKLAPTSPWGDWGKKIEESSVEARGGFVALIMQETWIEERLRGHYQARVEPSLQIAGNSGIFMQVNHHTQLINAAELRPLEIIEYLADKFEESIKYAEWIIDNIMQLSIELAYDK